MFSFILNLPYTVLGLLLAVVLVPRSIRLYNAPRSIVVRVSNDSFGLAYMRGWRGMTVGHTVLLNRKEEDKDLEHELIHVRQYSRYPLIFPMLFYIELLRKGYRNNKYEQEAYDEAGNVFYDR